MQIAENVVLGPYTTFKIGGPARFFVRVSTLGELQEACAFAREKDLRILILGGGSNMLVDDAGFDGLVVKVELMGMERMPAQAGQGDALVACAGESWDALVERAAAEHLWGIENLSGIPGTVGGAVVQGIGAYGAAVGETLLWVEVLDSVTGDIQKMTGGECRFGYRDSFFKHDGGRHIVLRAAFGLSAEPNPNLSYKDVAERLGGKPTGLAAIREAVLEIRTGKFPDLGREGTAGSFFKNPIVPRAQALELQKKYPGMPLFDMPETQGTKVPLAWLLDKVLNVRGYARNSARLYEKQPLVVAVGKGASSRDVEALVQEIEELVRTKLGIKIEREVKVIHR